ncbi:hypothetical protein KFK09_026924 [Dendrobium nobile]|uniref:J domain-containing protein n=1 Tax=Dendrobium nobile TaxID=94219 RepID=A0A8T3A941_DENNO|nr:hypothetical protein KFK09_026924 [Dendrobium nobile]
MIIRAIMVPNCGNGSICPSPTTTNLSFAGSTGHRLLVSMATLRPRLPEQRSASRLASRPPAVAGDVGTIGELSATTESFYELLGIPVSGSHDDIKRAYKQLARKYHPDVSPPDRTEEYTQRFILVQEAYETLSDPECRALYDRYLARGLHYALSARRRFGAGGEIWVEKSLAGSACRAEEEEYDQEFRRKSLLGSSHAKAKGGIFSQLGFFNHA